MRKAILILLSFLIISFLIIDYVKAEINDELIEALTEKNLKKVKLLIVKGANVNGKDKKANTPLHNAAYYGDYFVVKLLIEKEAHINAKNNKSLTPLDIAIKYKKNKVIELLKKHGAKQGKDLK